MIAHVDLAVWDMATVCGSCHVGGGLVEQDLADTRLTQRPAPAAGEFNAIDHYVNENYNSATGLPEFSVEPAPWNYSYPIDGNGDGDFLDAEDMADFMMPNVREMDCFMCHLEGYNNILSSAAVQMGYLNAAPSMSAGLTNLFAGGAYIPGTVEFDTTAEGPTPATLSGSMLAKLKPEPPTKNCQQCHTPDNMANFTDMFEIFLSAAPMEYNVDGAYASPLTGKALPSYDLNAAFVPPTGTSPQTFFRFDIQQWVYGDMSTSAAGPFGLFPMALDSSWSMFSSPGVPNTDAAGGGRPGMSGPLYYAGSSDPDLGGMPDQNAMKKSTIPFPKADWFKRGDLWEEDLEVHYNMGCGGCHYNAKSSNPDLNQCDPGRGNVRMGGIESGKTGIDTRGTVKTCRGCHIDGTNWEGDSIQTFNAPDPTAAHRTAGLLDDVTQAEGPGGSFTGNHLDVIDCSVCHIYKKSMAVRALDCTSGKRFPTLIGIDNKKGMMGMFTDPMTVANMSDAEAIGAFTNNMLGMGYTQGAIDYMLGDPADANVARSMLKNELQQWQPIYGWHANAPAGHSEWRRKIIPINFITAQLWDDSKDSRENMGTVVDANGDGDGGEVLWDPWISRDMKAGVNFSNTGFATVPTGFGSGSYQSAYDANGLFTGAFDYVGIYGGNIILTKPDEITAYKTHREDIKDSPGLNGRSWENTELVFQGGNPFQVTHNIAPTSKYVLGKSCSDCHAPDSGFFSGQYDMTGTAVPASPTYDPDGPCDMETGKGCAGEAVSSNMMQRPVVDYEVVALKDDLRTAVEAKRKDTGAVEHAVHFDELGCWPEGAENWATDFILEGEDGCPTATHRRTHDLDRSEFMYPLDAFPGTDTEGNAVASRDQWIYYLESIGAAPSNPSISVPAVDAEIIAGNSVTLTATDLGGPYTYYWSCTDTEGVIPTQTQIDGGEDGLSIDRTFNTPGTFTLRLAVKNNNTGETATASREVTVVSASAAIVANGDLTASFSYTAGDKPQLEITAVPANTNRLVVIWGDGKRQVVEDVDPSNLPTLEHAFQTFGEQANLTTEVRAVDYPNGGLLAIWSASPDSTQLQEGTVADAVTITGVRIGDTQYTTTGGVTTNIDLVTIEGTRAYNKQVDVACTNTTNVGSVWYKDAESWSVDVQLAEGSDNCTATVGTTATDSVDLTYTPATGAPDMPYNLDFGTPAVRDSLMDVTLTGTYMGTPGNTVDVTVNYPSDANVGPVTTNESAMTFSVFISGLLHIDNNYVTVKEVDTAGNDSQGNYFTIQYETP